MPIVLEEGERAPGMTRYEDDICVKCGERRASIRKHRLICGTVSYEGELIEELGRHRFTPFSKKEVDAMRFDIERYMKCMMSDKEWEEYEIANGLRPPKP
jgi:hypothetical protein